ncbi:MAG: hypothetical protein WBA45_08745 [Microthrixaceae bacterium]
MRNKPAGAVRQVPESVSEAVTIGISTSRSLACVRLRGLLLVALLGIAPLAVSCSRSDANHAAKPRTAVPSEKKVDKEASASTSDSSDGPETSTGSDGTTAQNPTDSGSSPSGSTKASGTNSAAGDPRGSIHQVEPPKDGAGELTPVDLGSTAKFGSGVTVRLKSITATTAKAVLPGEISGPAVRVTVEVTNSTASSLNLDNVAVELITMTGTPAGLITSSDAVPFKGNAASGATSTGTYVFSVDPAKRDTARLSIKYSANTPTAIFTGSLPHG